MQLRGRAGQNRLKAPLRSWAGLAHRGRGGTPLQRLTAFLGVQAVPEDRQQGWFPRLTQDGGTAMLVCCSPGRHLHPAQSELFCFPEDERADWGCP